MRLALHSKYWMQRSCPMRPSVRSLLSVATLSAVLFVEAPAAAQSSTSTPASAQPPAPRRDRVYLTQLSFVLEGARRILLFGEAHAADPEMSRFAYPLSEHYVELAGKMTPGERLRIVHPHLLIVVENVERAFNASAHGDLQAFRQHVRTIREELATLEAVLKHLKVRLPETVR